MSKTDVRGKRCRKTSEARSCGLHLFSKLTSLWCFIQLKIKHFSESAKVALTLHIRDGSYWKKRWNILYNSYLIIPYCSFFSSSKLVQTIAVSTSTLSTLQKELEELNFNILLIYKNTQYRFKISRFIQQIKECYERNDIILNDIQQIYKQWKTLNIQNKWHKNNNTWQQKYLIYNPLF